MSLENKNTDYIISLIQDDFGVPPYESFDATGEVRKVIIYLKDLLLKSGKLGFVLGISGGVDSTCAGKLASLAVDELNAETSSDKYHFYAINLPYGEQADSADVDEALSFISATDAMQINIKDSVDSMHSSVVGALAGNFNDSLADFNKANVKARARMMAQYEVAGLTDTLVIGTDHRSEYITGFFTKWGDGACDVAPLAHLNKRKVRALAKAMGAPRSLFEKVATADLEDSKPQLPDEVSLGVTYDEIDDILEGKIVGVPRESMERLAEIFVRTEHKRNPPLSIKR